MCGSAEQVRCPSCRSRGPRHRVLTSIHPIVILSTSVISLDRAAETYWIERVGLPNIKAVTSKQILEFFSSYCPSHRTPLFSPFYFGPKENGMRTKLDSGCRPQPFTSGCCWCLLTVVSLFSCRLTVDFSVLEFLLRIFLQWPQETGAVAPLGVMLD